MTNKQIKKLLKRAKKAAPDANDLGLINIIRELILADENTPTEIISSFEDTEDAPF